MANQFPTNFPLTFDASKMPEGIRRVDGPTPQFPFIESYQSTTESTSDKPTPIGHSEDVPQEAIQELRESATISVKKRKRRSKEEHNQLKGQIIRLLNAGYDVPSLQVILGARKDKIVNCLGEILSERGGFQDFSPNKQFLPKKKLRGLNVSKQSDYWEATRLPNGDVRLTAVDMSDLRKGYGIVI